MPTLEIKLIHYNQGFHSTHSVHKSIPINDDQTPRYTKAHYRAACEYIKLQMVEYNKQIELTNKTCQLPGI